MKTTKTKILVLGADGFLGSKIIKSLLKEDNFFIRAFNVFERCDSEFVDDIEGKIEIFSGDFLSRNDIKKSLVGIDYVFHFFSFTTPGSSTKNLSFEVDSNIKGTIVLLEECVASGIKKIVFYSSGGAVYGDNRGLACREEDLTNPISPYAISKLAIEKYLEYFKLNFNLNYLILRYANFYGPGQKTTGDQSIIPIFLGLVKNNQPINVFGDGENVRDFIYIDDLVEITKTLSFKKTKHSIYNIGSGKGKSINEIISVIRNVTKKEVVVNYLENRASDVKVNVLDISRVATESGFNPRVSIEDGIKKTWDWINSF